MMKTSATIGLYEIDPNIPTWNPAHRRCLFLGDCGSDYAVGEIGQQISVRFVSVDEAELPGHGLEMHKHLPTTPCEIVAIEAPESGSKYPVTRIIIRR